MPLYPEEFREHVLFAAVSHLLDGIDAHDPQGGVPPEVQEEVDAIAELADDPEALAEAARRFGGEGAEQRTLSTEWSEEDERKHPRGKGGKWAKKGEKEGDTAVKEKPERQEWDGHIEQDEVERVRRSRQHEVSFNTYDEHGDPWETDVWVEEGEYNPFPDDPDSEPIRVFRWYATAEGGGILDSGEWVEHRDAALAAAQDYASASEEEEPEEDEEDGVTAEARELREQLSDDDILDLAGVSAVFKAGASVKWYEPTEADFRDRHGGVPHGFLVEIEHPDIEDCQRFIGIDSEGEKFIKNEILILKPHARGGGIGAAIFSAAVKWAADNDFSYLKTHAAGNKNSIFFNGYYTWPRFGYDQSFDSLENTEPALVSKARRAFPEADSVLDIFEEEGGAEWWKENGRDLRAAVFDLAEGSRSRRVLAAYLEERAKRTKE